MTGTLYLKITAQVTHGEALNVTTATAYFVQVHNPYAYTRFNMTNHKIINLPDPTDATDATDATDGVNLKTLKKHIIKPSDHTNRFAYLMAPTTGLPQWTELLGDSIALTSIGDLNTTSGNYHTYIKTVIYSSIKKELRRSVWKLAIQCFPLQKDKEYTLCLEILTTDYQLWHKSVITIDKTTSQGVTVKRWHVSKFTHEYKTSSNHREFMYYHKVVVVFIKTTSSTLCFLHVENTIAQAGSDLGVYPTRFNKILPSSIWYSWRNNHQDLDPNKTYDYHKAFDIKPTKVVYNVDPDMNKKILNITLIKTIVIVWQQ